jgi:hypothetical protein
MLYPVDKLPTGHGPSERERVAAKLGEALDDRVWTILKKECYTDTRNPQDFRYLVARAREYQKLLSGPTMSTVSERANRRQVARPDDWRTKALALADDAAARATRTAAVVAFRREILKNKRLSEPQARRFLLSRGGAVIQTTRVLVAFPGTSGWVERVAADRKSVLGRLWTVAAALQKEHGWHDYQAVWFVLTRKTPFLWPIDVDDVSLNGRVVAIRIAAAPWMPARVVFEAFRRLQRKVATARSRPLSDRRLALVRFPAHDAEESYRAQLARWNRTFPHWSYADVRGFVRDLKAAQRQMDASTFRLDYAWPD